MLNKSGASTHDAPLLLAIEPPHLTMFKSYLPRSVSFGMSAIKLNLTSPEIAQLITSVEMKALHLHNETTMPGYIVALAVLESRHRH